MKQRIVRAIAICVFRDGERILAGEQELTLLCVEGSIIHGPDGTGMFDTFAGKPKKVTLGAYPSLGLADARRATRDGRENGGHDCVKAAAVLSVELLLATALLGDVVADRVLDGPVPLRVQVRRRDQIQPNRLRLPLWPSRQ